VASEGEQIAPITDDEDWRRQREHMVRSQLDRRGIRDARVLAAMAAVPRHLFVPERSRSEAYGDQALAIGHGQTISQPYIVAAMLELLALRGDEKVLDVGVGSGYQTALLSGLAREVIGIERVEALAQAAEERLCSLGCENTRVLVGDGTLGLPDEAPFGAIVVAAAAPEVPRPLLDQLAEGGRLVIPVGDRSLQRMCVVRKEAGRTRIDDGMGCVFVPLIGEYGWS
jgi:protein-L-isoaspartate(D-aspartate) O-methyltransferase